MAKNLKDLKAAAIRYDPAQDSVPLLTAFGQGYVAETIIALAEEAEVPIVYDAALAAMLSKISVGAGIPPELYTVVAQILLFVSESDLAYAQSLRSQADQR